MTNAAEERDVKPREEGMLMNMCWLGSVMNGRVELDMNRLDGIILAGDGPAVADTGTAVFEPVKSLIAYDGDGPGLEDECVAIKGSDVNACPIRLTAIGETESAPPGSGSSAPSKRFEKMDCREGGRGCE